MPFKPGPLRGIILLEGADHSGKTTLARHLVDHHGARYLHGRIFPDMWRYHVAMVRLALRWADHQLVIIDRMWLSELTYGEVFRGGPSYDVAARCLDRVLMRVGAVTVVCSPDDQEFQIKRHAARAAKGEEVFKKIQRVVALYSDLVHGNAVHPGDGYLAQLIRYGDYAKRKDVFVYDLDKDGHNLKFISRKILARVRQLQFDQLSSAMNSSRHNFTGNLATARSLIVGDRVSPRVATLPKGPYWPMCWHDGMSAATWLNHALHMFGHDETTTIVTNANDPDNHLTGILKNSNLKIVALGKNAVKRLEREGYMPHVELSHPQYHRRFHHSELSDYSRQLKKALASA